MIDALKVQKRRPTMKKHSNVSTATQAVAKGKRSTIGIDVSDKSSRYCILDGEGAICAEGKVRTTPDAFRQQFGGMERALIALEAGTHSRWMSELLGECGHEVIVANPRRLPLLTGSDKKNDVQDARTLAEMGWAKPGLLAPIQHRSAKA